VHFAISQRFETALRIFGFWTSMPAGIILILRAAIDVECSVKNLGLALQNTLLKILSKKFFDKFGERARHNYLCSEFQIKMNPLSFRKTGLLWSGACRFRISAIFCLLFVFSLECWAQANVTVNGTGGGKNWGNSTTWLPNTSFSSNGTIGVITYSNATASATTTNNNLSNMTVGGITVSSARGNAASAITGNGFILNGNVTNNSTGTSGTLEIGSNLSRIVHYCPAISQTTPFG
jgi:hypothetical protein